MTTKTAQFTPGPWSAYNSKNGVIYKHWRVNTGTGLILLDDAAHWEAGNATLIAAAPAMYEALKGCLRVAEAHLHDTLARWEDYEGKVPSGIAELDAARMEVVRIQNALAQAEGR